MALASLAALGLAIFLGFVKKMNTGLLCTALALLVGRLAGISDDEIIRGFNYSLFLMLLGVTYLFGLAEINGTLALLSKKIVALSGRRTTWYRSSCTFLRPSSLPWDRAPYRRQPL